MAFFQGTVRAVQGEFVCKVCKLHVDNIKVFGHTLRELFGNVGSVLRY